MGLRMYCPKRRCALNLSWNGRKCVCVCVCVSVGVCVCDRESDAMRGWDFSFAASHTNLAGNHQSLVPFCPLSHARSPHFRAPHLLDSSRKSLGAGSRAQFPHVLAVPPLFQSPIYVPRLQSLNLSFSSISHPSIPRSHNRCRSHSHGLAAPDRLHSARSKRPPVSQE
jgi:hypothetical protein